MSKPTDSLTLGVILERRASSHPWADHVWRPLAVVPGLAPGGGPNSAWRTLREGPDWAHILAGSLELELYAKETDGYRVNLAQSQPAVFVVLRPGEEADDPEVVPFHVTACPYEAQDYEDSGDEIVEGVAMPDEVRAWLEAFVAEHHVEQPFKKRQRKPYDPRKGGFARRQGGAGD